MKRSRKGQTLFALLVLAFVAFAALHLLAVQFRGTARLQRIRLEAARADWECRGGLRWGLARARSEEGDGNLEDRDEAGALVVQVQGDEIRSTYTPSAPWTSSVSRRLRIRRTGAGLEWSELPVE